MEINSNTVAVVTGASSGIGRCLTLALLEAGASVVANARPSAALDELAREAADSERLVVVPGDVADSSTARRLLGTAVERFGHLDVWVNNAAVMTFGAFEDIPEESFRRVIDVNLHGYVNGARAALGHFRRRGRGILVNVSSILGKLSAPQMSAYIMSKFAIQGLGEALRNELALERGIRVCNVIPGGVNTALYRHCANYSGRIVRPMYPLQDPEAVAKAILKTVARPRRERRVGRASRFQLLGHLVSPSLYEKVMGVIYPRITFGRAPLPPTHGNLFEPSPGLRPAMKPGERVAWVADSNQEAERVAQPN